MFVGNFVNVFSTYVEVILEDYAQEQAQKCVLHVCGGDPKSKSEDERTLECSPRMWR